VPPPLLGARASVDGQRTTIRLWSPGMWLLLAVLLTVPLVLILTRTPDRVDTVVYAVLLTVGVLLLRPYARARSTISGQGRSRTLQANTASESKRLPRRVRWEVRGSVVGGTPMKVEGVEVSGTVGWPDRHLRVLDLLRRHGLLASDDLVVLEAGPWLPTGRAALRRLREAGYRIEESS
jgi:hypothetical protein